MSDRAAICALILPALPSWSVDQDPNVAFTPPNDAPYAQIRFVEGAEALRAIGGVTRPVVIPVLVYVDLFVPLGTGDGLATQKGDAVRDALRFATAGSSRWRRFAGGTEGTTDTHYRYQVVALFWRNRRV